MDKPRVAITLADLRARKARQQKFSMLTAYDASFAAAISAAGVDAILVGDSLGMVVQGHASTVPVHIAHMVYHTAAVARANTHCFLLADMPFMAAASDAAALRHAARLMRAGAQMVKLEANPDLPQRIAQLSREGVPVCAHFGLTPQSIHRLGRYQVQYRGAQGRARLLEHARAAEAAGADMLLVECVPAPLAAQLAKEAKVPVVGIGAGPKVDGQVLVMHDMLGVSSLPKPPRFVENFLARGDGSVEGAFRAYHQAVLDGQFPRAAHAWSA